MKALTQMYVLILLKLNAYVLFLFFIYLKHFAMSDLLRCYINKLYLHELKIQ